MTDSTEAMLRIFAAKQGARDSELIGVILNQFFGGPSKSDGSRRSATIIELDATHRDEAPKIRFSDDENDLRLVREA